MNISFLDTAYHPFGSKVLYELLKERDESVNISHKSIPSFEEHLGFINSMPYKVWSFILVDRTDAEWIAPDNKSIAGSIYLTKLNEIGIFIFKNLQNRGIGKMALQKFIEELDNGRFLANINPHNNKSIKLFESLNFKHIQNTYEVIK